MSFIIDSNSPYFTEFSPQKYKDAVYMTADDDFFGTLLAIVYKTDVSSPKLSVILIGFMGTGKSTVAKALSAAYIDLDRVIERQIQRSIASYFEEFGEAQFRVLEGEVLAEQLKKNLPIATGGGIVERIENRKLLKQHMQVVYLKADFSVLFDRILNDATHVRPLAKNGEAVLKARYLAREKYYETLANLVINVNQKTPEEIARHIREWQKEREI